MDLSDGKGDLRLCCIDPENRDAGLNSQYSLSQDTSNMLKNAQWNSSRPELPLDVGSLVSESFVVAHRPDVQCDWSLGGRVKEWRSVWQERLLRLSVSQSKWMPEGQWTLVWVLRQGCRVKGVVEGLSDARRCMISWYNCPGQDKRDPEKAPRWKT